MGSFFGRIIVSLPLGESSASLPRKAMGLDAWWGWGAGGLVAWWCRLDSRIIIQNEQIYKI
jgi:hypothetical protein